MKRIFTIFLFVLSSLFTYALNFTVYPTNFSIDSRKLETKEVNIVNNTEQPLRVEIYPEADVDFGKEYNLNSVITVFPKTISIKSGATQKVRFRVKPDERIKEGENRSFLTFKEIPSEIKTVQSTNNGNEVANKVQFITEISIPIVARGTNLVVDGSVKNVEVKALGKNLSISCDTVSKGNTAMILNYELSSGKEKYTGTLGSSARIGEQKVGLMMSVEDELRGKSVNLRIFDQNGKEYFNNKVVVK